MTKINCLKISVLFLVLFTIVLVSGCMQSGKEQQKTLLQISNIKIEPIDKNSANISWETNMDTYSSVGVNERSEVNEILRKAFNCNNSEDLVVENDLPHTLKKYGCSSNESDLILNGRVYSYGVETNTNTDYSAVSYIGDSDTLTSKQHSVTLDFLQPNTEYTFKIEAVYSESTPEEAHVEKSIKFKMP